MQDVIERQKEKIEELEGQIEEYKEKYGEL